MKDTIVKTLTLLIGFSLLAYVGWLFIQGYQVTQQTSLNMLMLAACFLLAIFLLLIVFMPRRVAMSRWMFMIVGIVIIFLAEIFLVDNATQQVYLADTTKLVGVYVLIMWVANMLISKDVKEKIAEQDVEIIEV